MTVIDHIVITSPSLAAGADFVRQQLGAEPQSGGEHPRMGTHNLLLHLGESLYLEVIAVNPHTQAPERPRWFGLDDLKVDARPRLSTWVARVDDIHKRAVESSEALGKIETMSRGDLSWFITIPVDGVVPIDGVAPALIEWHANSHPATRLKDQGLKLVELEIFHPQPERVSKLLASLAFDGPVSVSASSAGQSAHLLAHIETPEGMRRLSC